MRVLLVLLVLPATAAAQDLPARLSVEQGASAEQCAGRADLERRVESILQSPAEHGAVAEPRFEIDVRFERAADGAFVARVSATGAKPGTRVLRDGSPSCDALSEAVSVTIALLVDDALGLGRLDEPKPKPERTTPASEPAADTVKAAAPAAAPTWRARAAFEAGGGYGLGGSGAPLGLVRFGARGGRFVLDVGGAGSWPSSTAFDTGSVRTSLLFGSARVCYQLGRSFAVAPCALLAVGRLHGAGTGYGTLQSASLPWTAGGLGLAAETRFSQSLFLSLGATLWVPTRRQTFSVQNAGIAWESKPLAGMLSVGLGVELF